MSMIEMLLGTVATLLIIAGLIVLVEMWTGSFNILQGWRGADLSNQRRHLKPSLFVGAKFLKAEMKRGLHYVIPIKQFKRVEQVLLKVREKMCPRPISIVCLLYRVALKTPPNPKKNSLRAWACIGMQRVSLRRVPS